MIYFAVIEKNTEYASYFIQECKKLLLDHRVEFQSYRSYEEFMKDDFYLHDVNIVFSHVSLKEENEIECAKSLKIKFPDMGFIFYGSNLELIPYAYEVEHLFFIYQPHMGTMLKQALPRAVRCVHETKKVEEEVYEFLADRILFIQDLGNHTLRIVTENREYKVYMSLNDIMSLLQDHSFIKADDGYFIQSMYISKMDSTKITFVNGTSLKVHCSIKRSLLN